MELWNHQKRVLKDFGGQKEHLFLWDPGTGKTRMTLEFLKKRYKGSVYGTLILGPFISLENWYNEIFKYTEISRDLVVLLNQDSTDAKLRVLRDTIKKVGPNIIVICNYESLVEKRGSINQFFKFLNMWKPPILVCDESQYIKDPSSKRTKRVWVFSRLAKIRYLLTGTHITNSPLEVYAQFKALDNGATFGSTFIGFKQRYFEDANSHLAGKPHYFPNWKPKASMFKELNEKIFAKASRVVKSECLDLPPLIHQIIEVGMTPAQAKHYEEMKKDFVTYLNDDAMVAELAMTKALRLMQITSGYLKFDTGEVRQIENTPKIKALGELLTNVAPDHKIIVWACFRENYAQIGELCKKLSLPFIEAHGEIEHSEKFSNLEKFNTDPKYRVLIAHPKAVGIAVNLVAASYAVYFSRNFSLEQRIQSEARNYRGGSEIHKTINLIDIVVKDTIEQKILETYAERIDVAEQILNIKRFL